MFRLTKEQVLLLQQGIVDKAGGSTGLRDDAILDSALNAPFQSYDGHDAFSSLQQKAARLGYGLIKNHAFVDGNKRIGAHVMLVFLNLNGIDLAYTQQELVSIILDVASSTASYEDLLKWVVDHEK